jgi:ATP-dependent protease ClpP protease subunit
MSLRSLPEIRADQRLSAAEFDVRQDAFERWHPEVQAASETETSISIYDSIGENWDGTGITAKLISSILRNIGADKDVTVNINSPGGNFFEGVAIYNLLREHKGKVTTRVIGVAASAASVVAMAGDDILMGDGTFLMIHNAWTVAIGNRHDMAEAAALLEPFDAAMAKLYANRSGITVAAAAALMDDETWIDADQALKDGFATGRVDTSDVAEVEPAKASSKKSLAMVEASMKRSGYSRAARRDALKSLFTGTPSAAYEPATPCAGAELADSLRAALLTLGVNQQ